METLSNISPLVLPARFWEESRTQDINATIQPSEEVWGNPSEFCATSEASVIQGDQVAEYNNSSLLIPPPSLPLIDSSLSDSSIAHYRDDSSHINYSYREKRIDWSTFNLPRPSSHAIKILRRQFPDLFQGKIHHGAKSRYDLNLLNLSDLLANWDVLGLVIQSDLTAIIECDWSSGNCYRRGIKPRPGSDGLERLIEHLVLLATFELQDSFRTFDKIIPGILKDKDLFYGSSGTSRRYINPRAAYLYIKEFHKEYDLGKLFRNNNARILLFLPPADLRYVGENVLESRKRFNSYFDENKKVLTNWVKKGQISAFVAGHEISIESIAGSTFKPHTHAVVWVPRERDHSFLDRAKDQREIDLDWLPEVHGELKTVYKFIEYMMKTADITSKYRIQFNEKDPMGFNIAAINSVRTLIELNSGSGEEHGKQKIVKSGIPEKKSKK